MKELGILVLAAAAATAASGSSLCSLYVSDRCPDISGDLLAEIDVIDEDECSLNCESVFASCRMYIYYHEDFGCRLYSADVEAYAEGCEVVAGNPLVPAYDECFGTGEGCNDFRSTACGAIDGDVIADVNFDDVDLCHELCVLDPDCGYFVHDKGDALCTTYYRADADCDATFGPQKPAPSKC